MPFVDISFSEQHHSAKDMARLGGIIHTSLVEFFKIPEKDLFQMLHPCRPDCMIMDDTYMIRGKRSEKAVVIKITCVKGRTDEQKKALYAAIAAGASRELGMEDADVFILIYETERSAWSFGNGEGQMIS